MSGLAIQQKVTAGLAKAGRKTGSGELKAAIIRSAPVDETVYPPVAPTESAFVVTAFKSRFRQSDYASLNIETGDLMLLVEGGVVEPLVTDQVKVSGIRYTVVEVMKTEPGGVALIYKVQLRGGIRDDETYVAGVDVGTGAGLTSIPIETLPPLP